MGHVEWDDIRLNSNFIRGSTTGDIYLVHSFFWFFVNDFEGGIKSKIKFFAADDISLFSIIHEPSISASGFNHNIDMQMDCPMENEIQSWSHQTRWGNIIGYQT